MSRSIKRFPVTTWVCCKSQKRGKQNSHRKFRRQERMLILSNDFNRIPYRQLEIMNQWDLGGDGKVNWMNSSNEEWIVRVLRK